MKIGFVFDDTLDKNDGIQQYMFSLEKWLISQGHEVHYLVGETTRTDKPHVHSLSRNVKVRFNGNRLSIPVGASKRRVQKLLLAERFDVLHIQVPYHPLMAGRIISAAKATNTAVIGTFHVAPYSRLVTLGTWLLGVWSRPTLKKFHKIVSVSTAAADLAHKAFGIQTDILPNVFDYGRFHGAKPFDRYQDNTKTIVFLGRLVPRKGCMQLLQAVAELKDQNYRVVICGAGPLEQQLRAFTKQRGIADKVEFAGRISEEDKPRYLASADISVFPSSGGESFGIVLIEAMASGQAAVLGGSNPGYATVLGGQPFQLFDTSSVPDLAQKLNVLLNDESKRQSAAAWGAEESRQYDVNIVGQKLVDIYKQFAPSSSKE